MTARRTGLALTLCVGAAFAIAACGGTAATGAPSSGPATEAPVTEVPSAEPLGSSGLPGFSFALPSFTADTELEALFPKEIAGKTLQVISMSGSDFMGTGGAEIAPVLTQLGKTPSDLSAAFGGTADITIIAFKIKGVPADQFLAAYTNAVGGTQGASITDASYSGKSVKKVVTSAGADPAYVYTKNDVIWTVGGIGGPATDALLNEAFSKLP